jgi:GTPase SAR1 family protein
MIIVTGADNTGKTTLINQLVKDLDLTLIPKFGPKRPWEDPENWAEWVYNSLWTSHDLVIADRLYVDELVYGPIKRGKICINDQQMTRISARIVTDRPLIILCEVSPDILAMTYNDREQYPTLSEIFPIMLEYRRVLNHSPFNSCPQHIYDFNEPRAYPTVLNAVKNYIKAKGGYINECE